MINIATTLRYVNLEKISPDWEHRFYIMQDYFTMADKLGFGICAIMNDKNLERICDQCDGLIIPGSGMSYNPKYWGGPDIEPTVDEYALDAKLIDYFIRQGKPIFGICGGLQTLNIYLGGSIREIEQPHEHGTGTPMALPSKKTALSGMSSKRNTLRSTLSTAGNWTGSPRVSGLLPGQMTAW